MILKVKDIIQLYTSLNPLWILFFEFQFWKLFFKVAKNEIFKVVENDFVNMKFEKTKLERATGIDDKQAAILFSLSYSKYMGRDKKKRWWMRVIRHLQLQGILRDNIPQWCGVVIFFGCLRIGFKLLRLPFNTFIRL